MSLSCKPSLSRAQLIALTIFILFSVVFALYMQRVVIRNVARIRAINVCVFKDAECTVPLTFIDWGILVPEASVNYTAYVVNFGNCNSTLSLYTDNWSPEYISEFIVLVWDAEGSVLVPNAPLEVTLTLTVSPDIYEVHQLPIEFTFDIIITATLIPEP